MPKSKPADGSDEPADRSDEPPAGQTVTLPPPRPGSDPDSPRVIVVHPDRPGRPGQVVIYEDGEMPPYWEGDPGPPPAARRRRSRRRRSRRRRRFNQKWGINLRLDGVLLPSARSRSEDEGMGGIGASVRYRPMPHLAFDAGVDYIGGIDANGYRRYELPVGLNLMFFPNPHSLAQFYLFGGVNWSMAEVQSDTWQSHLANGTSDSYGYFGGQLGLGLEFRVSPLLGIHIDGLGFARTRTDDDEGGRFAEYISRRTGETSNSSAGGMLRIGVNFWW
ncbi:MAG: outer membrane beta-barrel protein [Polyangiaceae bacterium]